jgi:hypothetical protein
LRDGRHDPFVTPIIEAAVVQADAVQMQRFTRKILAAAVSGVVVAIAAAALSSGSTATQDKSRDVAVNVSDAPATSAPVRHHRRHTHRVVLVHFGGRKHSCSGSALRPLHAARARIAPLAKRAYAMETSLRKIERKYAKKSAPAAAVTRYDTLYKSYKAELRRTKRAIHTYNGMLRDKCDR